MLVTETFSALFIFNHKEIRQTTFCYFISKKSKNRIVMIHFGKRLVFLQPGLASSQTLHHQASTEQQGFQVESSDFCGLKRQLSVRK